MMPGTDIGTLQLEDRTPRQFMLSLLEYYAQIPFTENRETKGQWNELFKDQRLFFEIEVFEKDLNIIQAKREVLINNWDTTPGHKHRHFLSELLNILERWLVLSRQYGPEWVSQEIKNCIEKIPFENIHYFFESYSRRSFLLRAVLWKDKRSNVENDHIYPKDKKQLFEEYSHWILNCLLHIQRGFKKQDWDQLITTQDHPPHIGLMYGFCKAFEHIKKELNHLPERHLDFYYKTVLQQKKNKATPDFTYVFLSLKESVYHYELPKETVFNAGTREDGTPIQFKNLSSVSLSGAKIAHLSTLMVHASMQSSPLNKVSGVSGIYFENIPLAQVNNFTNRQTWPLFGAPSGQNLSHVGWAMGSPLFFTRNGTRTFNIGMEFSQESSKEARNFISTIARKSSYSTAQLYTYFFYENFEIHITTPAGWKKTDHQFYLTDFINERQNIIGLSFALSSQDEAWSDYDEKIHQKDYHSNTPLLEIIPKQHTSYYAYTLLNLLRWTRFHIDIEVENSKSMVLYNKHGLIDESAPFPLLGVNPLQGDEFQIANKEWQYKNINTIDLDIEWNQLPYPDFKTYYKEYETDSFRSEDFIISTGHSRTPQSHALFSLDENACLNKTTSWKNIKIDKRVGSYPDDDQSFTPGEYPRAFIKFKLARPTFGFGHGVYRNEMINFSKRQSHHKKNKSPALPPNPPFVPYAKRLSVNYRSSDVVQLSAIQQKKNTIPFSLYHIHPLGKACIVEKEKAGNDRLVPHLAKRGYLNLGLQHIIPGQVISLYFKLKKNIANIDRANDDFHIEYLAGDQWTALTEGDIIKSTITEGTSSGVLSFKIPAVISAHHPFYSSDCHWFRISVDQSFIVHIGACQYIKTNPVKVVRDGIEKVDNYAHIPAHTISNTQKNSKEVLNIEQPMPSIGGKDRENDQQFYTRVANRLRHKNRMVRIEDFKDLLYEQFEDIKWVKVVTPSTCTDLKPGEIHLIIMPGLKNYHNPAYLSLNGTRKQQIAAFVQSKTHPDVVVKVFSPVAEIVKVYADLVIDPNASIPSLNEIYRIIDEEISPWSFKNIYRLENDPPDGPLNIVKLTSRLCRLPFIKEVKQCGAIKISYSNGRYNYVDTAEGDKTLSPSTYKNILIPAEEHKLNFLERNTGDEGPLSNAIGEMVIGSDLIIKAQKDNKDDTVTTKDHKDVETAYYLVKVDHKKN